VNASVRAWLEHIGARGTQILAASIFIGLLVPPLAAFLRPTLTAAVFLLLAIAMVRVELGAMRRLITAPLVPALAVVVIMIATPLAVALAFELWRPPPAVALAIMFAASTAPIVSSPAISYLVGLDGPLSLGLLIAAMVLTPFIAPVFAELVAGEALQISGFALALRLAGLLVGAALAAALIRKVLGEARRERLAGAIDGVNVLTLVVFAVALMDGVSMTFLERPALVLGLTALAFALNLGLNLAGTLIFWRAGPRTATTIGFSSGNRNLALIVGALGGQVPLETWIFFAVAQFPIYLMPAILKPVYTRLISTGRARPAR